MRRVDRSFREVRASWKCESAGLQIRIEPWAVQDPCGSDAGLRHLHCTNTVALFREPATTGTESAPNSLTLDQQQRERALRAEVGAWKSVLPALPWILILNPSSGHPELYFTALLLNAASVYRIATWLIPLSHRRGK